MNELKIAKNLIFTVSYDAIYFVGESEFEVDVIYAVDSNGSVTIDSVVHAGTNTSTETKDGYGDELVDIIGETTILGAL